MLICFWKVPAVLAFMLRLLINQTTISVPGFLSGRAKGSRCHAINLILAMQRDWNSMLLGQITSSIVPYVRSPSKTCTDGEDMKLVFTLSTLLAGYVCSMDIQPMATAAHFARSSIQIPPTWINIAFLPACISRSTSELSIERTISSNI